MNTLQQQAIEKYNRILMGNGAEYRAVKLYNIHILLEKQSLTDADIAVLEHFVNSSREIVNNTVYTANAVYSVAYGNETHVLEQKVKK